VAGGSLVVKLLGRPPGGAVTANGPAIRSAILGARLRMSFLARFLGPLHPHLLFDIASKAYEHAPQALVAAYQYTAPIRQIYKDRRVPVKAVHGLIKSGQRASLLVAGAGQSIDYMLDDSLHRPCMPRPSGTFPSSI